MIFLMFVMPEVRAFVRIALSLLFRSLFLSVPRYSHLVDLFSVL